jgi:hypothetical protein
MEQSSRYARWLDGSGYDIMETHSFSIKTTVLLATAGAVMWIGSVAAARTYDTRTSNIY